jgi:hypothetical protein
VKSTLGLLEGSCEGFASELDSDDWLEFWESPEPEFVEEALGALAAG